MKDIQVKRLLPLRKRVAAVALVAACVLTALAAGCGSTQTPEASEASVPSATSLEQYADKYPLQCASIQGTRVNAKGITIGHTVENLAEICEAPTVRDANGDPIYDKDGNVQMIKAAYDAKTGTYDIDLLSDEQLIEMNLRSGCVSCKTSRFNEIYAQQGASAFGNAYNAEARAIVNGDYFDCAMCHDGEPSSDNVDARLMFYQALGEGFADRLEPNNAVCAQCHNSYDYRSSIKTEEDLQTIKAYRNGYDVDSLFETCWEDDVNFETDPATGIRESILLHPTIELFMDTKMQELGTTCVDCHMPQSQADGQTYTNHFAANSPLESEDSLAYCLNCHERQGIASADAMAQFVREKQAEMAQATTELEQRKASFRQSLEQAIGENALDGATLEHAKKLYAKVSWYDKCLVTGPSESLGSQAAMMDWRDIVQRANATCDEGMGLLG